VNQTVAVAVAFAAGAVAGGLFVRWYVTTHVGQLGAEALGAKLFGEGSTGAHVIGDIGSFIDSERAA